uniref:Reverse transcriptase domain-containing protein n=1 Tax=Anolis carolinensis TaxID=28377 RepID=A0A803T5W2_ANOCA
MNGILENQKIPDSWKYASITTIPKEAQDLKSVKNYRPISLLNVDYKIFANILAERLKDFLKEWIKEEQSGFIPKRQMKDNVREIINIIEYYEFTRKEELALLTIDMEKAFDNLNWDFFKLLIQELDMGYKFTNAINQIYDKQEAKIKINSLESKSFSIGKGTRQGCPLSPLLFIFSLEILLNNIREDPNLKGAKIKKYNYKIRAYADDLICIIEDPIKTIPNWLFKIREFGEVSGLNLNMDKTMILPKNMTKKRQEELTAVSGIQTRKKIKYLGITLTARNFQLLENNYVPIWREIKKDLEKWKYLNLSLLGRISVIKMSILPKMLFLFQNIPIVRKSQIFKNWNKDISKFVWKGKKPRIRRSYMIDEKKRGGLRLPDLQIYHDTCGLIWVKDWATLENTKIITLEGIDLRAGWHAYLWYGKKTTEKKFGNHFIRSSLIKIWDKYRKKLYWKTPRWISPLEACQRREIGGEIWPRYKDILVKENGKHNLQSQEEINRKFPNVGWFQYMQLKEYYNKDKILGFEERDSFWDKVMTMGKKQVSIIYTKLIEWETEEVTIKENMTKWAKNLGEKIYLEEWEKAWNSRLKATYATELKENWIKMFYRWYLTPQKLSNFYKKTSNKCWKCGDQVGTFFHCWWTCKKAEKYWKEIHQKIQEMLHIKVELDPKYFLLGMLNVENDKNKEILFNYLITAARITYAKDWKKKETPELSSWLNKVLDIMNMDKLTYLLKNNNGIPKRQTDWGLIKKKRKEKNK